MLASHAGRPHGRHRREDTEKGCGGPEEVTRETRKHGEIALKQNGAFLTIMGCRWGVGDNEWVGVGGQGGGGR